MPTLDRDDPTAFEEIVVEGDLARRPSWTLYDDLGGIKATAVLPPPGQEKGAKFPTSKAHISVVFHSFWLIFGRVIISRNGLEA